ncbi:MAG: hypothetical protein JWQ04_1134 [Pedosphaera sp.]|nr:hypothetical protein [Pedosphaera sp.]
MWQCGVLELDISILPLASIGARQTNLPFMPNSPLDEAKQCLPLPALMARYGYGDRAKKSARCMFHDDSRNSFSIYQRDDGTWAWKCHAVCGGGDEADWLATLLGLSNADACREFIHLTGTTAPSLPPLTPAIPSTPRPFDWPSCVAALTPEHREKLARWRGYAPEFVEWLHGQNLIGLFNGAHIAFPVHDSQGNVIGCHYRIKEDGSWRYHPTGTHTAPFIIGDTTTADTLLVAESQWDLLSGLASLDWHIQPLAHTAAIATRGASNGRLLAGVCPSDAVLYAFAQNDEAAQKWLAAVASSCGCKCVHVLTPGPHKDMNDWARAGATGDDIRRAILEARPVIAPAPPDLRAARVKNVSKPVRLFPDEHDEPEPAPFPVDAFPPVMASMVAGVARTERVPLALPAVCALGVASAAIGAGLEVVSGPNRVTRANLYLLASADSGSGKSETFRIVAAPLVDYQTRLIETWRLETSPKLQSELRVLDSEIATLEKKAAKTTEPFERDQIVGELKFKIARKDDLTRVAAMPCIIAQDVTTERLAVLLRDNREVVFSASADARKLVDNLMGRYNPGKMTDESLYLSAYSGDLVRVDRQGRDPVVLNKPCLSLCWFAQPDLLATMLDEESLSVGGFLPRLLVCDTKATPHRIEGEERVLSESVRDQWNRRITDLIATFRVADNPHRLTPTPEAVAILNDYHNRIVDRRANDLADVGAFAARYAENAWRVSVVLHGTLWGTDAGKEPLTAETAANAVRIVEWFAAEQQSVLAKGRHAAAVKIEEEVLKLLKTNLQRTGRDYITARDVLRARIISSAAGARTLLGRVEGYGVLTGEDITPAHGGKTTRVYRAVTNPVPE